MIPSGKLISAARTVLGWRQRDLALAAGLHRNAIQYWERHAVITRKHQPKYGNCGLKRIERAFLNAGVLFVTDPGPGIVLVPREPISSQYAPAGASAERGA